MHGLEGRVAIVTGGGTGIGRAVCLSMATEGVSVVVNFPDKRREAAAFEVVESIAARGGTALALCADVSLEEDTEGMIESVYEKFDRIDILVNNAGIVRNALVPLMDQTKWDAVMGVNLGGVFLATKAVLKYMIQQKRGAIVNIASAAVRFGGFGGDSNYLASKGGVAAFTKAVAVEMAQKGIRVNAVAPGVIVTDMTNDLRRRESERLLATIPMRRFGEPEDVAKVVVFLASDDASYITGETIHVTGGI
jgi:3-oxoacyl-[acyl-carrier protein] reductase